MQQGKYHTLKEFLDDAKRVTLSLSVYKKPI